MSRAGRAVLAALAAAAIAWVWPGAEAEVARLVERVARLGWLSLLALAAALAVRPLRRRWPGAAPWRRPLGLAAATLAGLHVGGVLLSGWIPDPNLLVLEPHYRSGTTAAVVLLVMSVTSFKAVNRALGVGHWRLLHRAIYPAALLLAHHVALASHAAPVAVAAVTIVALVLVGLRVRLGR